MSCYRTHYLSRQAIKAKVTSNCLGRLYREVSKVVPRFQKCKFVILNIENCWYRGVFKRGRIGTTRRKKNEDNRRKRAHFNGSENKLVGGDWMKVKWVKTCRSGLVVLRRRGADVELGSSQGLLPWERRKCDEDGGGQDRPWNPATITFR